MAQPKVLALALTVAAVLSVPGRVSAAPVAGSKVLSPPAPITGVTVYPDRALITRTAEVVLPAGTTEVLLEGLPGGLVDASVRATGRGAMPVKITGVDVSRQHLARPDDARVRALEAEIRAVQDTDQGLRDEIQTVQTLQRYLQTVQARSMEPPKETQVHRIDVDGIRGVFGFLAEGLAGLARRQREAEVARRDLQGRLQKLQRELDEVRAPAGTLRKAVGVGLETARPGPFELQVSYLVPGAGWAPAYEARALRESGEVELTYGARVRQQTGEPWEGVALALSTARPAVGGHAPRLTPWVLQALAPAATKTADAPEADLMGGRHRSRGGAVAQEPEVATQGLGGVLEEDKREEAVAATADLEAGGPSVLFKVARPAHIPNDARQHKTTVAVTRSRAEFSYLAVPKRSPFAYLVARLTPGGETPLLAGPVEVFRGADYLGRSRLESTAPDQPFDLHLGVDEGIKVRRQELVRERGEGGVFTRTLRTRIAYEIVVENFKRTSETVTVTDQLPVARDQEIEVGGVSFSADPTEKAEQGILKWRFRLAPQEKRVIRVEFTVAHPAEKAVAGL